MDSDIKRSVKIMLWLCIVMQLGILSLWFSRPAHPAPCPPDDHILRPFFDCR